MRAGDTSPLQAVLFADDKLKWHDKASVMGSLGFCPAGFLGPASSPLTVCDVGATQLPSLSNYGL